MINSFSALFEKQLQQIETEIRLFERESDVWQSIKGVSNCAGNLVLHLHGNLNHFIGSQLGNTGFVRDRSDEFSEKNFSRDSLVRRNNAVIEMMKKTFSGLTDQDLTKTYPLNHFGEGKTTHEVLLVLISHLNYHLGQINYYRRLVNHVH